MAAFREAKTAFGQKLGEATEPQLKEGRLPKWSEGDQCKLQLCRETLVTVAPVDV